MKKMKPIEGGGERDISTSLSSSTKEARTIIKIWDIIIFLPNFFCTSNQYYCLVKTTFYHQIFTLLIFYHRSTNAVKNLLIQ